ncbi:MAG: serine/threonine-protein kinase, partial [Planctomycetota bacterium]
MSAADKPLHKEQFERVSSLFSEALAIRPAAGRVTFAKERAADDPAVLRQLLDMLGSHEREEESAGFEARADGAVREETGQLDAELLEALPQAIGAFQIIRHIATGGMGTVYEAVQEEPHRRVALKVLRAALMGPESIERFEFEGQILARLRHPGIAQVYTMGRAAMSTGHVPYIVMEFVDGRPINDYVRENRLQPRATLALLAKVCDAIRYAHRRGIIHRDIKPSNILVDSSGDPRVLDFGIARPFGDAEDDAVALTASGLYLGTLPYMSPEQAAGGGAPLDVRTDVYSLGAVGYELLTGHPPHDLKSKSLPEAFRILADRPAPLLETVDKKLGGDISVIIAKSLATDAARRYSSVEALDEDIQRFLGNKPIRARADSRAYQLRLFVRRNRVGVFIALAGVVALVISLVLAIAGRNEA